MENLSWSSDSGEDEPMDDAASIATSIAELSTGQSSNIPVCKSPAITYEIL